MRMPPMNQTLIERLLFWAMPEPNSGCWLWTGAYHHTGYGTMSFCGVVDTAHRWSWRAFCGEIPRGKFILHKCDNRGCCNPQHLYVGGYAENARDTVNRGRSNTKRGEALPQAILTEADVRAIRGDSRSNGTIARELGVSRATVQHARSGRNWAHLSASQWNRLEN